MPIVQRADAVRMVFADSPERTDLFRENPGKVFCIIGPFEDHMDKPTLEEALTFVVRGFNFHPSR
jgi:hypothetical protein